MKKINQFNLRTYLKQKGDNQLARIGHVNSTIETINELTSNLENINSDLTSNLENINSDLNTIDVESFITDQEFYEFGNNQLIPDFNYYGSFEKGEETYHLVGMVEMDNDTLDSPSRQGNGFYLGSFRESGSQLTLANVINLEEFLSVDLLLDYEFVTDNAANIDRAVTGTADGKVNIFLFNYPDPYSFQIKNTFLLFDVDVNNSGVITISNIVDRKANDVSVDTYDNILAGYDIQMDYISDNLGKEVTFENPGIFYFLGENGNEGNRIEFVSYNNKTGILDVIVENFATWWGVNSDVPFIDVSINNSRIINHNTKVLLWVGENFINQLEGNSYLVEFNPDKVTALGIVLNNFSGPLISKDKIYLTTILQ